MSPSHREETQTYTWIRAQVAAAPPLSEEQRYRLKYLLAGVRHGSANRADPAAPTATLRRTA